MNTAFTAFTAVHPTDHEDCQEGFRSRCVRLVGTAAILITCRRSKAVKAVKPVI